MQVIYENKDFLIVSKPAGIEYHGDSGLVALIRQDNAQLIGVHRLDRDTTGAIIFAKNKEVASKLGLMFQNREISKTYIALAGNKPSKKQGMISGDIVKTRGGSYTLKRSQDNPSITQFMSKSLFDGVRLYWLIPKTGRTHQLRVVLKSLGVPILGDKRYGGDSSDRMYLHAFKLEFEWEGEKIIVVDWNLVGNLFENNLEKIKEIVGQIQ